MLNSFRFVAIVMAKDHHFYPTIVVLSLDRFGQFKHLFISTFHAESVGIFPITIDLTPTHLFTSPECVKNQLGALLMNYDSRITSKVQAVEHLTPSVLWLYSRENGMVLNSRL